MPNPYDQAWRHLRPFILLRDSYLCQIQGHGCTTRATTVDHILELDAGGARLDPRNLRAACRHCNASLGATYGNGKREPRSDNW